MKQATQERYDKFVIGNYTRYPLCLVRGQGARVWDDEGRAYLDLFPGWGCGLLGHCPPAVVQAVQEQAARLIHVPNTWHTEPQALLAEALSIRTTWNGKAFFCNSGAEANEAAIKLARLAGKATGRYKIVTMLNGFHGRTLGALSATAQPKYHSGVEPLVPGFNYVPFGDLGAVARAIDGETIAVMLEPIQGEGGVNLPPDGYLEGLRALCDQRKALLIFDEVQTGMGRTGAWYAHQHWHAAPDIVTLAKALAGGVAMGGLLARPEVAAHLRPGTHAATFGGNPLACAAALAAIGTIEGEGLLQRAAAIGERFAAFFESMRPKCPWIKDVRVRGCMIGAELSIDGSAVVRACLEKGLLINATHGTVLRLLPAMNLTDAELEEGCGILEDVLVHLEARA